MHPMHSTKSDVKINMVSKGLNFYYLAIGNPNSTHNFFFQHPACFWTNLTLQPLKQHFEKTDYIPKLFSWFGGKKTTTIGEWSLSTV